MAVSRFELPKPWLDALRRAARGLSPGDPYTQVFLEFREDLRIRIDSNGGGVVVPTRTTGAVARTRANTAYLSDPRPGDLEDLVRVATGGGARHVDRPNDPQGTFESEDEGDPTPALEDLVQRATRAAGSAAWASVTWASFDQRVAIARGDGETFTDHRRGRRVRLEIRILRSGGHASAVGDRVLRDGGDDPFAGVEIEVARRAEERLRCEPVEDGEVAAVFAKGTGGVLVHEIVGHALENEGVRAIQPLLIKHPPPVASAVVSVVDDPRRGRGAWRVDDEGNEARPIALLVEGRVAETMTDQGSGARCTGHGRRASYRDAVRPRMGCTFLAPGRSSADEIVATTNRGVLVRRMEAVSNDLVGGRALFRVSDADRIVDGRIGVPLAPFLMQVGTLRALGALDAIADDLRFDTCVGTCLRDGQPLAVSVGAPTFRIGVVRVRS